MDVFILGTGGSMPLPHRHLTSMLVRREGDLFLFDCGEGTQVSLRKLNLRWKKINTIFISHTHADHVTGLPGILMLSSQVDRDEPLYIIGPPKIRDYIEANRKTLDMYINYEIIIEEIKNPHEPQVVFETDDYLVKSFPLYHTRACVGYTLEEKPRPGIFYPEKAEEAQVPRGPLWSVLQRGESVVLDNGKEVKPETVMGPSRKGRKISYVTDTLPVSSIKNNAANSDFFLCEGMFEKELEETAREKKHMTAEQAAKLAMEAGGIKKLVLFHFSPRYTERELRILKKEAEKYFPNVIIGKDRQTYSIPFEE